MTASSSFLHSLNNNGNNNNDNRPARKDYNKLTGNGNDDQQNDITAAILDNDPAYKKNCIVNGANDTDTESSFTDIELDDRDDFSDSDYDEALTCNVCDRSFSCPKQLASHKQKKRHFGCSSCDSLFTTLMALEHHKEEFEHWSGGEDDFCTDSEDEDDTLISEECERLL